MKSSRALAIMAAMSLAAASAPSVEIEDRDERDRRAKTPPPDRPPQRRVKAPRYLTERDVERVNAANDKRARRAARNLRLANADGRK